MPDATPERDHTVAKAAFSFVSLGVACGLLAWALGPPSSDAATHNLDLSDATFVEVRTLDGAVVMSGELRRRVDSVGNVEKDAALLGPKQSAVVGEIEIEVPRAGSSDQRQELEVDVISLAPHTSYQVIVNDRQAATFTTDDRGSVDVEFLFAPGAR
jgi:hypothetical protein